jgi:hypothetical protein
MTDGIKVQLNLDQVALIRPYRSEHGFRAAKLSLRARQAQSSSEDRDTLAGSRALTNLRCRASGLQRVLDVVSGSGGMMRRLGGALVGATTGSRQEDSLPLFSRRL